MTSGHTDGAPVAATIGDIVIELRRENDGIGRVTPRVMMSSSGDAATLASPLVGLPLVACPLVATRAAGIAGIAISELQLGSIEPGVACN